MVRLPHRNVSECHSSPAVKATPDIKKVEAAGGKIVTPNTPIPGIGAYARVADMEDNVIGLFQNQH